MGGRPVPDLRFASSGMTRWAAFDHRSAPAGPADHLVIPETPKALSGTGFPSPASGASAGEDALSRGGAEAVAGAEEEEVDQAGSPSAAPAGPTILSPFSLQCSTSRLEISSAAIW